MLQSMGVQFPTVTLPDGHADAASATFWPHTGVLIVRNTQDNLDMVDALVDQANASQPKQVEIESKFIEITQNNLKELGFDWLLGPFNIGNHKVFETGGKSVNSPAANPGNFPFVNTTGQPIGDTQPGQPIGQFPVMAEIAAVALRSARMPSMRCYFQVPAAWRRKYLVWLVCSRTHNFRSSFVR